MSGEKKTKPKKKPKEEKKAEEETVDEPDSFAEAAAIKAQAEIVFFDAEKQEVKSLAEILEVTSKPKEIYIPEIGCKIKVGALTMKAFTKINEAQSSEDKSAVAMAMLYELLHSGDPSVTQEQVDRLHFPISTAIINAITAEAGMGFPQDFKQRKKATDS